MSYINSFGVTAGPIKINGSWINTIRKSGNIYMTITADHVTNSSTTYAYRPMLAGTPDMGSTTGEDGKTEYLAPDNAVVTVEWLKALALDTGGVSFNPLEYVRRDEYSSLELKVNSNTTNINALNNDVKNLQNELKEAQEDIAALESKDSVQDERILRLHEWVLGKSDSGYIDVTYPTSFILNCGNAASYSGGES